MPQPHSSAPPLTEARNLQQAGDFAAAETLCREVLRRDANDAHALHRLGVLAYLQGRSAEAVAGIHDAIARDGGVPEFYVSLCLALLADGRDEEFSAAMQVAESKCLGIRPADTRYAEALHRLGVLADLRGEHAAAIAFIGQALARDDGNAETYNNLGLAQLSERRSEASAKSFAEALARNPHYLGAASNLSLALAAQGKFAEAIAACRRVLVLKQDFPLAWFNLGSMQQQAGEQKQAEQSFLHALSLRPDYAEAHNNLGAIYQEQGRVTEAVACYRRALALKPMDIQPRLSLAGLLHNQGRMEEAAAVYRDAQLQVRDAGVDIQIATMLPPIIPDAAGIAAARERYRRELDALGERSIRIGDLQSQGLSNFFLPYHGFDDKALQQLLASVYIKARPDLVWSGARTGPAWDGTRKLRLGFISANFKNHSIGKLTQGLIANVSRERFRVITLFAPPFKDDETSRHIRTHSDEHHILPADLQAARESIAGLGLDVLFFADIGMDLFVYFLAFARLAPAQCVTWGHPDTTGIPNIDYFISHEDCETADAPSYYSEKLMRLSAPSTFTCFSRPSLPARLKTRAEFGLADAQHLYICPQSLFKFHPDFDPVLEEILRRDPRGRLILIDGATREWNELLLRRLSGVMDASVLERVIFLPRQYGDDFLNLIAVCDVMLDAFPFAGGTSSFEGFATGIPIVTMPTRFLRGRCTHALYRVMGIADCTAATPAQYVEIALALGTDAGYRERMREKILARSHLIYDDLRAVREYERCFEEMSVAL